MRQRSSGDTVKGTDAVGPRARGVGVRLYAAWRWWYFSRGTPRRQAAGLSRPISRGARGVRLKRDARRARREYVGDRRLGQWSIAPSRTTADERVPRGEGWRPASSGRVETSRYLGVCSLNNSDALALSQLKRWRVSQNRPLFEVAPSTTTATGLP